MSFFVQQLADLLEKTSTCSSKSQHFAAFAEQCRMALNLGLFSLNGRHLSSQSECVLALSRAHLMAIEIVVG